MFMVSTERALEIALEDSSFTHVPLAFMALVYLHNMELNQAYAMYQSSCDKNNKNKRVTFQQFQNFFEIQKNEIDLKVQEKKVNPFTVGKTIAVLIDNFLILSTKTTFEKLFKTKSYSPSFFKMFLLQYEDIAKNISALLRMYDINGSAVNHEEVSLDHGLHFLEFLFIELLGKPDPNGPNYFNAIKNAKSIFHFYENVHSPDTTYTLEHLLDALDFQEVYSENSFKYTGDNYVHPTPNTMQ